MQSARRPEPPASAPASPLSGVLAVVALGALVACSPPPSGPPTQAQAAAFANQADNLMRSMKSCDDAAAHATGANYDASLSAEGECERTANTLVNFRFGDNVGQQFQDPLNTAVATCWTAYDAKARGLAKLAQSANAETAPEAGPLPDFSQIDVKIRSCVAELDKTARTQGFKDGVPPAGG